MMLRLLLLSAVPLLVVPASLRAQCCGGELRQDLARVDQGKLHLRQVFVNPVCETHQRDVEAEVDGKKVVKKVTYSVTRFECHVSPLVVDLDKVQGSDTFGKKLDAKALATMLKTETPVVLLPSGLKPDPQYMRVFKKGTVVLMMAAALEAMPAPVAMPAPGPAPARVGPAPAKVVPPPAQDPKDEKLVLPKGLQPMPSMASIDETGTLRIRQRHDNVFMNTMAVEVEEKGKKTSVPLAVRHTMQSVETREIPGKHVRVFHTDGKPVPSEKLAELLANETNVLVSTDGNMADPFYLQIIRDSALILVLPQPVAMPAQPVPAPPRKNET